MKMRLFDTTSFCILMTTFASLLSIVSATCYKGDSCKLEENVEGIVKVDTDCDYFVHLRKTKQRSHGTCGFEGLRGLVCCPLSETRLGIQNVPQQAPPQQVSLQQQASPQQASLQQAPPQQAPPQQAPPQQTSPPQLMILRKAVQACKEFGVKPESDDNRIINGNFSDLGEFPHFAQLAYRNIENDEISFDCGGVLISSRFVLTAAHCCLQSRRPEFVRLGKTAAKLSDTKDPNPHVDIDVKTVKNHPDYKLKQKHHDIALLELEQPVEFTSYIWPSCLQPPSYKVGDKLTIAGFGRTDAKDATKKSDWLRWAYVEEIPLEECREVYEKALNATSERRRSAFLSGITDDVVCAKNREKLVDACQGDSGSALKLYSFAEDIFYTIGITSSGIGCRGRLPGFYTRVSNYIDWIEQIVWPST